MLTECKYIHFTHDRPYCIQTVCRSVDNHFNDNGAQKEEKLLTDAQCRICAETPLLKSAQLRRILLSAH